MNYRVYKLSFKEIILSMLEYVTGSLLISYLFYDDYIAFLCSIPLLFIYLLRKKRKYIKKRIEVLKVQFCEMIGSVSAAILAGMSVENAFRESRMDMENMFGKKSYISCELEYMISKLDVNQTIETCLKDFSDRTGIDEIKDFYVVFCEAKNSGGNLTEIISKTIFIMKQKAEIEQEIITMLNGKIYEQKIMNFVPLGIILYLKITSKDSMNALYHNTAGAMIMTGCLFIYVGAYFLSKKIMNIEI